MIKTNGLHSGTELLSLGLFVFIECWGVCRCTDLDDILEKARQRRRQKFFNGFGVARSGGYQRPHLGHCLGFAAGSGRSQRRACSGRGGRVRFLEQSCVKMKS
jgi:hypothetical protein